MQNEVPRDKNRLRPLPTSYAGLKFRSRLEARWAVLFDGIGMRWEYEPQGYDLGGGVYYLPDFWLPSVKCWVEVKPERSRPVYPEGPPYGAVPEAALNAEELEKVERLAEATRRAVIVLDGLPRNETWLVCEAEPDDAGTYWTDVEFAYPKHDGLWIMPCGYPTNRVPHIYRAAALSFRGHGYLPKRRRR